jgi:hypothetical protein
VKSLQTISVRHPTKLELMIYVDAETRLHHSPTMLARAAEVIE